MAAKTKAKAKSKTGDKLAKGDNFGGALLLYVTEGCDKARTMFEKRAEQLTKEDQTAAQLAHNFVALRQACDLWDQTGKVISDALSHLKTEMVPNAFEREGLTSFTLDEGYRVTVAMKFAASIKTGLKDLAFTWLLDNELGDLIIETVNTSTLSAAGKQMLEEGKELPESLFNTAYLPQTSVTKTK